MLFKRLFFVLDRHMLRVLKLLIMLDLLIAAEFELSELGLPRREWRLHL